MAVLLIGGTDSSGGAGLSRDVASVCVPYQLVVTAVTAQGAGGVMASHTMPAALVGAQMQAATGVGAAKVGMLATAAIVEAVADNLPDVPLVLDPVIRSTSGGTLLDEDGVAAMRRSLFPKVALLTPNLPELAALCPDKPIADAAALLMAQGVGAVLVKGGHAHGDPVDVLFHGGQVATFKGRRYPFDLRGTGCQLASVAAAALSLGAPLVNAVKAGHEAVAQRFAQAKA